MKSNKNIDFKNVLWAIEKIVIDRDDAVKCIEDIDSACCMSGVSDIQRIAKIDSILREYFKRVEQQGVL
jgi:hypothetical protein